MNESAASVEDLLQRLLDRLEHRYHGKYHTDETIPSPYFDTRITTLDEALLREDLVFTYLHSPRDEDYLSMGTGTLAQAIEEDEETRHTERRDA